MFLSSLSNSFFSLTPVTGVLGFICIFLTIAVLFVKKNTSSPFVSLTASESLGYFTNILSFSTLKKKYGDKFTIPLLFTKWVFINDVQDFQRIFGLGKKKATLGYDFILPLLPRASLSPTNFSVFIITSLKGDKMQAFCKPLDEFCEKFFSQLPEQGELDLWSFYNDWVWELTCIVTFGVEDSSRISKEYFRLFKLADPDQVLRRPLQSIGSYIEGLILGECRIYTEIRNLIRPLFHDRIQRAAVLYPEPLTETDVASTWVNLSFKNLKGNEKEVFATTEDLIGSLFQFQMAAIGNTYSTVAWCIFHCLRNKDLGEKILSEMEAVNNDQQSSSDAEDELPATVVSYNKLYEYKCLTSLGLEITRCYTPGTMMRKLVAPFVSKDGVEIPAGTIVAVSGQLMRSSDFEEPDTFRPERFLDKTKEKSPSYFGFGLGTHACLGKKLALFEMAISVSSTLRYLDLEIIEPLKGMPELKPDQAGMIHVPKDPVLVKYKRKKMK